MCCIFERKKPPHQHKDGFLLVSIFPVIMVNIFLHKMFFSDKNNFAEATLVKAVMYKDLYACFDVTDHYFEKPGIGYYQVESI